MNAPLEPALARLRALPHVRYAELREVSDRSERLLVRDGRTEELTDARSAGVGVRVLSERGWGFACTPHRTEEAVVRAAERAAALAKASGIASASRVVFPERAAARGSYASQVAIDPFTVKTEDKLARLERAARAILAAGKPVRSASAWMQFTRQKKRLLTTEGTDVSQDFTYGACGMQGIAAGDDGRVVTRSYPTWQGGEGFQGGFEHVAALDLDAAVPVLVDELRELVVAPACPEGKRTIILDASQVGLQIHESCGHPTELDRALGTEISLAGGSFMQPDMLGELRYGSELVTIVADSTHPLGLGTFGWDDEGTLAGKRPLVERGTFVDYLSGRETAAALGRESTGTMRAESWNRPPLIRMVNVSLEPGKGSLEDLVADTDDGLLIATDRSWSIDDVRLNFHFSCEIAWEIKRGKRTRVLRDPAYGGRTPELWGACDAICGPEEWRMWGIRNCGKGDPMQVMAVGHGAAPARFRDVLVGSGGGRS